MKPAEEEEDVLDALGALASFARCATGAHASRQHDVLTHACQALTSATCHANEVADCWFETSGN